MVTIFIASTRGHMEVSFDRTDKGEEISTALLGSPGKKL